MYTHIIHSSLVVGALLMTAGVGTDAHAMSDEIPTQMVNEPTDGDLNGPCSLCRVKSLKTADEVAGSNATLELYFDDESGGLTGTIQLIVLTFGGNYHTVTIEDVVVDLQETEVFELEPVPGWDWNDDVKHIWAEPLPDEEPAI